MCNNETHATAVIDADGAVTLSGTTDRVPWWSFTKTALSITALRLVERGALSLDRTLPGQLFSLRQLLRHEAGLPDYGEIARYHADVATGKVPWPVDRLLAAVEADRLRFAPGTAWAYSNIGYLKVAQLIESVSGKNLATALAENVFDPAGLSSARLAKEPGELADVQMGSARGYHPAWVYHGLIVGTVADAARLLWSLTNGRLLQPITFATMMQRHALPAHRSPLHPDPAYGLGLMLRAKDPKDHPLGHSGEGPGSKIAVYAKDDKVAGVWTALPSEVEAEAHAFNMLT
jgi:CubicO group peptidase (beta-lactamase class C family)